MGRGKIEIKLIENSTNRQVTYSKRRGGIMKKAKELAVLCDAEVSLIMFSSSGKFSEYCSPSTTMKKVFDRYQQVSGTDLWQSHYEKMQNQLSKLKEDNYRLRREIRQRTGEDLDCLEIEQLRGLEQNLDTSLKLVRERKYHVISTQTDTYKKKIKSLSEMHVRLLHQLECREQAGEYDLVVDNSGPNYETALSWANGANQAFSFCVQPCQPNLHDTRYGSHELHLV